MYLLAFLVFLANLKLLKLMRFNHRIYLFTKTLSKAALPLFSFLVVFLVFYIAFSFLFYSIYGSVLPEYRSFLTTIETLFSAVMGGFDFETVQANNRLLGPVIFFSFQMVMVMISMNVFSTILMDSFAEVKADEHLKSKDYEVVNLVPRVLSYPPYRARERETLENAGHVSPRIWEITNKRFWGGAGKCEICLYRA